MLILFSLIINPYLAKSQDPLKDLQVSGSSVQIIFSSLSSFNNGIELVGWTRLKIKYKYTGKNGWQLMVNALEPKILHEGGDPNNLNLEDLKITATITSSDDPTTIINNSFSLSQVEQYLVKGDGGNPNKVNVELTISYSIGTPPLTSMINKAEGIYFVTLRFLLVEID